MQKLTLILLTTLFAQTSLASQVMPSYTNLALIVAETGASASWAAKETLVAEKNARKMEENLKQANEKLNSQLEQRFSNMLEASALNR